MGVTIQWLVNDLPGFVAAHRAGDVGRYRYAAGCGAPTLYSSTYVVMAEKTLSWLDPWRFVCCPGMQFWNQEKNL